MNNKLISTSNLILVLFICYVSITLSKIDNGNLRVGFYSKSCPQAERIVQGVVAKALLKNFGIGPSLIRLYFHDCFVNGCDASILLDATPSGEKIEKTSPGNGGVRGFEVIDDAKTELEKACPGTVSCADIISFAARDAAAIASLAPYEVPAGRRDGLRSIASDIFNNLPLPTSNVDNMDDIFTKKGMNKSDIVTLLGVHSIGAAHCASFNDEFRNFNTTNLFSPKLNGFYAAVLSTVCPNPPTKDDVFPLNIPNGIKLSTLFYNNVISGRAVIPADQSLLEDEFTSEMVHNYVNNEMKWRNDFRAAMVKLGKVDVLTGEQGEVRKMCRAVNK